MANESSAYGTVIIKGNSLDDCEKVLKNMRKFEHWAYPTYVYLRDEEAKENYDENGYLQANFAGCGRWAYESNIKVMPEHFDDENLIEEDFEIIFDFVDYEPGMKVLYKEIATLVHHKGQKLEDMEVKIKSEDIPFTWENLVNYDVESEETLCYFLNGYIADNEADYAKELYGPNTFQNAAFFLSEYSIYQEHYPVLVNFLKEKGLLKKKENLCS